MRKATCRECDLLTSPNGPEDSDDVHTSACRTQRIPLSRASVTNENLAARAHPAIPQVPAFSAMRLRLRRPPRPHHLNWEMSVEYAFGACGELWHAESVEKP